jgi:hypothetical protein
VSIPEVGSRNRLLHFIQTYLTAITNLTVKKLTTTTLTVPAITTSHGVVSPVDFEQVGGLVIAETYLPGEESSTSEYSWTLAAPPSSTQDWNPGSNNHFYALARVTFVVPASGQVRIQVRMTLKAGAANDHIYFRLNTASDGTSLGTQYQKLVLKTNATPWTMIYQEWIVKGLTPGTETMYALGAAADGGTHYLKAGGGCSGDTDVSSEAWPQFMMRAVAVQVNTSST